MRRLPCEEEAQKCMRRVYRKKEEGTCGKAHSRQISCFRGAFADLHPPFDASTPSCICRDAGTWSIPTSNYEYYNHGHHYLRFLYRPSFHIDCSVDECLNSHVDPLLVTLKQRYPHRCFSPRFHVFAESSPISRCLLASIDPPVLMVLSQAVRGEWDEGHDVGSTRERA